MKRNKKILGGVFIASMAVIGVGFAALSNIDLKITGNASVGPNNEAFNVKFISVENEEDGFVNCTITSDTTATCTANFVESLNDPSSLSGQSHFTIKYTGNEDIGAMIYTKVEATGSTESINYGINSMTIPSSGFGPTSSESNPTVLFNGESEDFDFFVDASAAKAGDSIEFEVSIVAEPRNRA